MFRNKGIRCTGALLLVALLVQLDQYTKKLAQLKLMDAPKVLWEGVFELNYTTNSGAAFGIFQHATGFFAAITIVVLILIALVYLKLPADKAYLILRLIAVFLAAGAVGNLIDRVRAGFVVDFFYIRLIDFPVFNVADIYVTCSMALLLLLLLTKYRDDPVLDAIFGDNRNKQ